MTVTALWVVLLVAATALVVASTRLVTDVVRTSSGSRGQAFAEPLDASERNCACCIVATRASCARIRRVGGDPRPRFALLLGFCAVMCVCLALLKLTTEQDVGKDWPPTILCGLALSSLLVAYHLLAFAWVGLMTQLAPLQGDTLARFQTQMHLFRQALLANSMLGFTPTAFVFAAAGVGGTQIWLVTAYLISAVVVAFTIDLVLNVFVRKIVAILRTGLERLPAQHGAHRAAVADKLQRVLWQINAALAFMVPPALVCAFWPWLLARAAYFVPPMLTCLCGVSCFVLGSLGKSAAVAARTASATG